MKIKNILIIVGFAILMFLQSFQIWRNEKNKEDILKKLNEFSEQIEKNNLSYEESFSILSKKLDELKEIENLGFENINNRTDRQFSKTVEIKETYENLLNEQQKQNISTVAQDSVVEKMIKDGNEAFAKKQYSESYEFFSNVLKYHRDNIDIRIKKALSLYKANPMNSSSYKEILEDCKIIKNKGGHNEELEKIEKIILLEQGATN